MTYDSPLWASEGWVISEVASFKEEGLVWWPQKDKKEKEKKESWEFVDPRGNWTWVYSRTSSYWTAKLSFFFRQATSMGANTWDPNYTLGVDFLDHDFL
jgi:hypothetical protein